MRGHPPPPRPERWQQLVKITQFMWQHKYIPRELWWNILVRISKENTDKQVIGLLESMCKVVGEIIDTHLRVSVRLHDVLH